MKAFQGVSVAGGRDLYSVPFCSGLWSIATDGGADIQQVIDDTAQLGTASSADPREKEL